MTDVTENTETKLRPNISREIFNIKPGNQKLFYILCPIGRIGIKFKQLCRGF